MYGRVPATGQSEIVLTRPDTLELDGREMPAGKATPGPSALSVGAQWHLPALIHVGERSLQLERCRHTHGGGWRTARDAEQCEREEQSTRHPSASI